MPESIFLPSVHDVSMYTTSRNPMTATSAELTNASAALASVSLTGEPSAREIHLVTVRQTIKATEKVNDTIHCSAWKIILMKTLFRISEHIITADILFCSLSGSMSSNKAINKMTEKALIQFWKKFAQTIAKNSNINAQIPQPALESLFG